MSDNSNNGKRNRSQARKVSTPLGLSILLLAEAFGIILLVLAQQIRQNAVAQAVLFLVSMVIIWYAAHPLSHYVVSRLCGVRTLFFYIGRSEMGKSSNKSSSLSNPPSLIKNASRAMITVGTKLQRSEKFALIPSWKRGFIFGSGAIIGIILLAVIELFSIFDHRYDIISILLGGAFFLLTLVTELGLSTKTGDLSKMKRELSKSK